MQYLFGHPLDRFVLVWLNTTTSERQYSNCRSVEELDSAIADVEMSGNLVLFVTDKFGNQLTSEEIDSYQTEAF